MILVGLFSESLQRQRHPRGRQVGHPRRLQGRQLRLRLPVSENDSVHNCTLRPARTGRVSDKQRSTT